MIRYRAYGFYLLLKRGLVLLICCFIFQSVKAQSNEWKSCVDSEYQKVYSLASDSIFVESIYQTSTGTVLTGKISGMNGSQQAGFVMTLDSSDHVLWAKKYLSVIGGGHLLFSRCISLTDGFLMIGRVSVTGSTSPPQTIIAKTDKFGSIIWVQGVFFDVNAYPGSELQIQKAEEGTAGDIILVGSIYLNGFANVEREGFVARLNNSGTVQYVKSFAAKNTNINECFGISISGTMIWLFGEVEDGLCSTLDPRSLYTMSIDYATGNQIDIRRYCLPTISGNSSFAYFRRNWVSYKISTGFQISGFLSEVTTTANFMTVNFDANGNFYSAFQVRDQQLSVGYRNILSLDSGNVLIQSAHNLGAFQSQYTSTGNLLNQVYYPANGLYANDLLGEAGSLAIADGLAVKYVLPCKSPVPSIKLFRRNLNAHISAVCVGTDTLTDQTSSNVVLASNPLSWEKVSENPFKLNNTNLNSADINIIEQTVCADTQIVSHLKITGPTEICSGQTDIVFHGIQNPGDHKNIYWSFDSTWMKKLDLLNDSTIKITALNKLVSGQVQYLHAEIDGCEFVRDSLKVMLGPYGQDSVILPAETTICPDATLTLKSSGKFQSYLWQNGSVDSVFHVSSVGQYSLTAVNYCGITSSDTVNIRAGNCSSGIFFPNVFSPNADGLNDIFRPVVFSPVSDYNLKIYNRFGFLLFESVSPGLGWDGTYHHQEQNQDGYVYCYRYTINGQLVKKCSTLILIH